MPPRVDIAIAAGLAALAIVGLVTEPLAPETGVTREWDELGVALVLVMTLPLAFRRRFPIGVVVVTVLAGLVASSLGYGAGLAQIALLTAVASAAYYTSRKVTIRMFAVLAGLLLVSTAAAIPDETEVSLTIVVTSLASAALAVLVGDLLREARAQERRLAELAVTQDRMRIAREVHDAVGHSLAGITLQARAARRRPERAARALEEIDALATSALAETRQAVGAIREPQPLPEPRLDRLAELARAVEGPDVHVRLDVEARDVPPAVQATAYRIVQESLSNVAKHARPATAVVSVRQFDRALQVEVSDDGARPHAPNGGHGLNGMRERAELCGGTLEAGPAPAGGWVVRATLPVA
jgi:signal transduction histidine kinase